jgi:hypothetical protein
VANPAQDPLLTGSPAAHIAEGRGDPGLFSFSGRFVCIQRQNPVAYFLFQCDLYLEKGALAKERTL